MPRAAFSTKTRAPSARQVLARNMVRIRKDLGWSQEDLALEAEFHRSFIGHVEQTVRNISLDNIERLARALGVQTHELLTP